MSLGPGDSPGFLLWRTTLRWQRCMVDALAPLGLTHVQFVILTTVWWLSRNGQLPSQREVAGHASADVMMTSQVLRALEARELVARLPDPADARVRRLEITPAGAELAPRARAAVEEADRQFFAGVTDQEGLLDLLRGLAAWQPAGVDAGGRSAR